MSTDELAWYKSSFSSGGDGDCVEVAVCTSAVHVRDSKHQDGPRLALSPTVWANFVMYAPEA
ncbi:DUF397 domain-containing protein [Streptomyces goshikiensis]|uniref:DUF397 domain-containing protein n=1 Tax=Streptomyces goshikiensis TaxID=1942 RepID=UPI00372274D0